LRTVVIGAGAVGLALASALLDAGEPLCLVARAERARELHRRGLARTGLFGEVRARPEDFDVVERVTDLAGRAIDVVLVCTKTFSSQVVAEELAAVWQRLPGAPRVVLFHNGWGSADVFAARLPAERVFSARVITGFRLAAPTTSEVTVHADAIHLGSLFGADPAPLVPLADAVAKGGLPCRVVPDIAKDLWAKVIYNCALNPLGALVGVPYGALEEEPETRALLEAVVREVFQVMRAAGFRTHWDSAEGYLRDFYAEILPRTARHESSMLSDLRQGRRTEIDALCGAVASLGARSGIATPVNAALSALIRAAESRAALRSPAPPAAGRSPRR
jgi:2-dehydropantoate 2-reductase